MSSRTSRPRLLLRLRQRAAASSGFTLIEVVVALAVLALVLGAIGAMIGTTVKGARSTAAKLPLLETAQSLLASLPERAALRPGTQTGSSGGYRWRMDVAPLGAVEAPDVPGTPKWVPFIVTLRVQGNDGPPVRLDTIRLVPKGGG